MYIHSFRHPDLNALATISTFIALFTYYRKTKFALVWGKKRQEHKDIRLMPVTFSIIRNRITAASLIYSARESKIFLSSCNRRD